MSAIQFIVPSMRLGDAEMHDVAGMFTEGSPIGTGPPFKVGGLISHEFFKKWTVTIDMRGMNSCLSNPVRSRYDVQRGQPTTSP